MGSIELKHHTRYRNAWNLLKDGGLSYGHIIKVSLEMNSARGEFISEGEFQEFEDLLNKEYLD